MIGASGSKFGEAADVGGPSRSLAEAGHTGSGPQTSVSSPNFQLEAPFRSPGQNAPTVPARDFGRRSHTSARCPSQAPETQPTQAVERSSFQPSLIGEIRPCIAGQVSETSEGKSPEADRARLNCGRRKVGGQIWRKSHDAWLTSSESVPQKIGRARSGCGLGRMDGVFTGRTVRAPTPPTSSLAGRRRPEFHRSRVKFGQSHGAQALPSSAQRCPKPTRAWSNPTEVRPKP